MSIREKIKGMDSWFQNTGAKYQEAGKRIRNLEGEYALKEEKIRKYYSQLRAEINTRREEVLQYYRIAKNNTSADAAQFDAAVQKPDIAKLTSLVYSINEHNYEDPAAAQTVKLCSGYLAYFKKQETETNGAEKGHLQQLEKEKAAELGRLNQKRSGILQECSRFLAGEEVRNLKQDLEKKDREFGFAMGTEDMKPDIGKTILYGYEKIPVNMPPQMRETAKRIFGGHYDSKGIDCPCGISLKQISPIQAEYLPGEGKEIRGGVRALLINLLRMVPLKMLRVSIFDSIHYSADILGDMAFLAGLPGGVIDAPAVNDNDWKSKADAMTQYYQKAEKQLAGRTVFEYNKMDGGKDPIPFRLLIINRDDKGAASGSGMPYLINNARRLGIVVAEMVRSLDGGTKGKDREKQVQLASADCIKIITDEKGQFFMLRDGGCVPFRWNTVPEVLDVGYLNGLKARMQQIKKGPRYFAYFGRGLPARSVGKREEIVVPFARDENEQPVSCTFKEENFAAYMMGAAGSGKSTLLHTIICSLMMNYHPDEVELWLVDFKKTEFTRYASFCPPHLKYLLLEDSAGLIFDLIDELTNEMNRRIKLFSNRGWSKLTDVPVNELMPAIFVIIDEFAQVSQKLRDSHLNGAVDYQMRLENLLLKGRAFGLKFIFSSQSFLTGVEGLTMTARKQIQTRFALKNSMEEMKGTLDLTSYQFTDRVARMLSEIRVYETVFKRFVEGNSSPVVDRYYNLLVEGKELEDSIRFLNDHLHPVESRPGKTEYVDKHPVLLTDDRPHSFREMIPKYDTFEKDLWLNPHDSDVDSDDLLLYPGVPCSFKLVKPVVLKSMSGQNILVVGGNRDEQANVLQSIINSWKRANRSAERLEIWSHDRYQTFKKFRERWQKCKCISELDSIRRRAGDIFSSPLENQDRLVICLGLDMLLDDDADEPLPTEFEKHERSGGLDLMELLNGSPTREQTEAYNKMIKAQNAVVTAKSEPVKSLRESIGKIVAKAPKRGTHFVFFFNQYSEWKDSGLKEDNCQHCILFRMPKADSRAIARQDTSTLPTGVFLYTDGRVTQEMRPHIYKGIRNGEWALENGNVVKA